MPKNPILPENFALDETTSVEAAMDDSGFVVEPSVHGDCELPKVTVLDDVLNVIPVVLVSPIKTLLEPYIFT